MFLRTSLGCWKSSSKPPYLGGWIASSISWTIYWWWPCGHLLLFLLLPGSLTANSTLKICGGPQEEAKHRIFQTLICRKGVNSLALNNFGGCRWRVVNHHFLKKTGLTSSLVGLPGFKSCNSWVFMGHKVSHKILLGPKQKTQLLNKDGSMTFYLKIILGISPGK